MEPLVELAKPVVAVEDDAVFHFGLVLVELGGSHNLFACGELNLVAIFLLVFLHLDGNLVEALSIHQLVVLSCGYQRTGSDEKQDRDNHDGLRDVGRAVLEERECNDDEERIAENQRAVLDDRLAQDGIDKCYGEDVLNSGVNVILSSNALMEEK